MSKLLPEALGQQLLTRIKKEDQTALWELQKLFARRIYLFVLRRIHDDGKADEITGDTLFEVWKKAASFRGDSKVSTWILGIARYKTLSYLREIKNQIEEVNEDFIETSMDEAYATEANGFENIVYTQTVAQVTKCLDELSAVQRECITLVWLDECSIADIASIQQCPPDTVKTRLFYGRKILKSCLHKEEKHCD